MPCDESWIDCYDPETKRQSSQWKHEGQTDQIHSQTFDDHLFDSTGMIYMHWVPTGHTVDVLREFRERIRQVGSVAFSAGQCPSPQLHPCHRLFDQDGHQDSSPASL